jgi:hypothetical protein
MPDNTRPSPSSRTEGSPGPAGGARNPADYGLGVETLHIGLVEDTGSSPERFFCASEEMAVVPIPSLTSHEASGSGVVFGPAAAARLVDHGRQTSAAARRIHAAVVIRDLRAVRDGMGPA